MIERDDADEVGPTIPENPRVGQRFMQAVRNGLWDVYDWAPDVTGEDVPERYAGGLIEADACLLVFGHEAIRLASQMCERATFDGIRWTIHSSIDGIIHAARQAIAKAKGE